MRDPLPIAAGWRLWSTAVFRSAGLPISLLRDLDSTDEIAAIDRWLALSEQADAEQRRLVEVCIEELERTPREERRPIQKRLSRLKKGPLPEDHPLAIELSRARAELEAVDRATRRRISMRLREIARLEPFREALIWQNRSALVEGVDRLLARDVDASDAKTRGHELLVASYAQRYATKNETIGSFGPIGWAELSTEPFFVSSQPGPRLIAERLVFFEPWAVHALAQKFEDRLELRRELAPSRHPALIVAGDNVTLRGRRRDLPAEILRMIELGDGRKKAADIAEILLREHPGCFEDESDVFERMEELDRMGVLIWRFDRATSSPRPELSLRRELQSSAVGSRFSAELDRLERSRDEVAAARSSQELDRAMGDLQKTFAELTGKNSTRKSGEIYAGRTLIYFDSRRDVRVALGKKLIDKLEPLSAVLQSARWFSWEIAQRYRVALCALHDRLGGGTIDLVRFWDLAAPLFDAPAGQPTEIVRKVQHELQRKWRAIFDFDPGERQCARDPSEVSALAAAEFAAPAPGWPSARHHSPDLMIAADSHQALDRGALSIVLGETHAGMNTVTSPFMLELQPDREAFIRRRELDLERPNIAPVWSEKRSRADFWSLSRHDFDVEMGDARSARPPEQALRSGELILERSGETLLVRAPERSLSFDCIAFFEHWLIAASHGAFHLFPRERHLPRLVSGDFVIARESWSFDPESLPFAHLAEPLDRLIGARVWARALGLPRWIFASIPEEQKPTFIDLESPVFVELFTKLIRKASALRVVEMLPRPDQLWLTDASGERYTSELRFAAVDPAVWTPPGGSS